MPWDKFVKKKNCSTQTFLELQCLVDDLVDFLELSMCQCFIILNILFDEVDKGLKHEKKIVWTGK